MFRIRPNDSCKTYSTFEWWKIGTFQPKIDKKIYFFYQHLQPLYDIIQNQIENFDFFQ